VGDCHPHIKFVFLSLRFRS